MQMYYLFKKWDEVKAKIDDKYVFIFLDYDGTLARIAKTPDEAVLSKAIRELLNKISNSPGLKLAFISGRALSDIKDKIRLKNVIYAGNHGLEIKGPNIKFKPLVLGEYIRIIKRIKNDLKKKIFPIKGCFLEDKGLSLSLHYRLVDKKEQPLVKTIFYKTIIVYLAGNKIKIKRGKKVLEVIPPLEWDKGKAVLWLLARQKFYKDRTDIVPIYIGDDSTDEDAFRSLEHIGVTIVVGKAKQSCAQYYIKDTGEVKKFLKRILGMQEDKS